MKIVSKLLLTLGFFGLTNLSAQPNNPLFNALDTIRKAQEFYKIGKYDTAARYYGKIPPGDTLYSLALLEKSRAHYRKEQYEACIETAQNGLDLKQGYYSGFLNLMASAYSDNEQAEKAYEIYGQAIAKYPSDYQLYYSRGATYHENEQPKKALEDYQKTIELNPFHFFAHVRLASLALNEERYAEALMSLGYAYVVADEGDNRLNVTVGYDRAVSGDMELESKNLEIESEKSFNKINLLLKSRAALRDDYKIKTDLTFPLVRQMHLTYSQLASTKVNHKDFWSQYYQPFYTALMDEGLFEELTYLMILGSEQDYHQKLLKKNSKDISEFYEWAAQAIIKNNAIHRRAYEPDGEWVRYFYHESSEKLSGIVELNGKKEVEGNYTGYYINGSKESEGLYNNQSNREGVWVFYHETGDTSRVTAYNDGSPTGKTTEWHDNGHLFFKSSFDENGKMNGPTFIYNRHGLLTRKLTLKAGVPVDTGYYYYPSGEWSSKIPMGEGKANGTATYYHENGEISSSITFKDDKRHGEAVFYHPGKVIDARVQYKDGQRHGAYTSFHPNGQLAGKGEYLEGVKSGLWKSYDATGILTLEETFDDKGKKTGRSTEYDALGRKTTTFIYKKGEIESYKIFDLQGQIKEQGQQRGGDFYLKYFNLYGNITSEGRYAGDHKVGLWKYYTGYGVLEAEENYDDEGNLEGASKDYFLSGELQSVFNYKENEPEGYFVKYHQNGKKKEEGWYVKGKQNGPFYQYFFNGALYTKAYYVNDKLNGPRENYDLKGAFTFVEYFDKGVLTRMDDYKDGALYKSTKIGSKSPVKRYYPNGQIILETEKYGPTFHGKSARYYGHGQAENEGGYANGARQGKWSYYFPNGQLNYSGNYLLGNIMGEWLYYHENGKLKEKRNFLTGKLHGENPSYDEEGNPKAIENYHLGDYHGKRYFYVTGGIENHIRIYDQGRIIGYKKETGAGADTTVVPIKNGTAEVKSYYANGQLARTYILEKGIFEGEYKVYYPNGTPAINGMLKDDEREGEYYIYYPNGQVKEKHVYEKGILQGLAVTYYPNGHKKTEIPYKSDLKNGMAIHYNENGEKTHSYLYVNDKIYEKR